MKKKVIVGIILIIYSLFIGLNFYEVKAYSGELDQENYITMPYTIYISNGIGTGTIYLSSSASDYDISYQKVDITESTFNSIQNKNEELNNYVQDSNNTIAEMEANVKTLQTEYETLANSGTATEEELEEASAEYNEAYQEYQEFYNTASENTTTLRNEFYSLIPDYTSSWTETTNSSDNVQLDFENYSGIAYFVLWAKIENGANTYYDMMVYSPTIEQNETITISNTSATVKVDETIKLTATSSINSEITWTSSNTSIATVSSDGLVKGIKEGTAVITASGSEKTATCTITVKAATSDDVEDENNGDWTDFSNAVFELKKDGISNSIIEISNVTPKNNSNYYLFITSDAREPEVTSDNAEERIILEYDSDSKKLKTAYSSKVAQYVELNQNLYVTILEIQSYTNEKVVIYGKKLERYEEAKYSDAFHATFITYDSVQLVTTFTHAKENNRKIQVKVGKITDISILQKIKNQDSSGFADLLTFAKSDNGIYDKIVDADKDDGYAIEYNAGDSISAGNTSGNSVINLSNLQDGEYYFLYVKTDDENGKYISQEAVTLTQADVFSDSWYLLFYGSSDFQWADFSDVEQDKTTATVILPNAGIDAVIWMAVSLIIVGGGVFSYRQYRKNNF